MDETFSPEYIERQADSEVQTLLARVYTIRQVSSEDPNIDYSFTLLLIGFRASDDPVSRWFQKYTQDAGIRVSAIYNAKSVKREDVEHASPTSVPYGKRQRFTESTRHIFSEAIRLMGRTGGIPTSAAPLLGVRHVMAAYIYGPGTHEQQLKDYGFERVGWSNNFLRFIRDQYPQDSIDDWMEIHRFQFTQEPMLDDGGAAASGPQYITVTQPANIRSEANTYSLVLGLFSPGEVSRLTGQSGDWYTIDYNGQVGYVDVR